MPEQISSTNIKSRNTAATRHIDNRAKWVLYYYLTGNPEQSVELAGYDLKVAHGNLVDWYKGLDLPDPIAQGTKGDLVDAIVTRLSVDGLAELIVNAAKDGKDNRIANQLIDLYQERERQQQQLRFTRLDVEQRMRAILDDEDFVKVVLTWIGREHIGRRLLTNPAYYHAIDTETILLIQDIINKEAVKRMPEAVNTQLA